MSQGMNKVLLLGNLGADPELRYTKEGTAVLHFRIATNETFLDKTGEKQERVEWHDIAVWANRAVALAKILRKGSMVLVDGSLRTHSYEKDSVKKWRTEVVARDVFLMPGRGRVELGDVAAGMLTAPPSSAGALNGGRSADAEPRMDDIPF